MKKFEDIKWKQHRLGKGHIQGLLMLDNGIELSVVAGPGMYSAGKTGVRGPVDKIEDVSSFEVGIVDENLPEDEQQWEVMGWQSREDIDNILKNV